MSRGAALRRCSPRRWRGRPPPCSTWPDRPARATSTACGRWSASSRTPRRAAPRQNPSLAPPPADPPAGPPTPSRDPPPAPPTPPGGRRCSSRSMTCCSGRVRPAGGGGFNVIHLEHAEALTAAAEQVGLPVVLQISENTVAFHGSLAPVAAATRVLASGPACPSSCTSTTPSASRTRRRGARPRVHLGDVRRLTPRRRRQPCGDAHGRRALPRRGCQRRGRAR